MLMAALRRLGQTVFVLFGISALVFTVFFATPGADPTARIAGKNASPQTMQKVRQEYGFDRPLPVQYAIMMKKLFITQDLASYADRGELVVPEITRAAPVTVSLVCGAAVIWVVLSIAMGTLAAALKGSWIDRTLMMLGLIGISIPVFWLGQVANLITQNRYHDTWLFSWVPALGYVPLTQNPWGWFKALVIPWVVLAVLFIGVYSRVLRADLVALSGEDFIRTARAKGLSPARILIRHGLRTAMVTFVSLFGMDFAQLVGGGALLTEVVFGLPGVGRLTYQALTNLDLPLIMATVMYSAVFVVLANAAVDMIYLLLDPRVRDAR
ncbi:peptide ABC transporter permease [Acetobacter pasteurianus]|uniref:Oligopeptide transporter permease protein OppB n=3 Tax=Acetobacter pasteurianus TaxID=438 RepID=C7JI45_ACEP3|nr:ABC transporter permease [Acetobacter pasteurianus]BAU38596.1 oligopeptide transporter permease OppB [Acetobacter pasteurianus NBRC 101655]ASC06759.1 Putative peptide transport system permease protein [Acetobacter pasteurianus subsp. pasteurianus]OAZ72067.1 putative peptide transport system permease protein [Acetobacter pasteurianus]RCL05606.1 peptide ABC transporter permease [Acetobacter pasteurianus]BAH99649.1 oligopeptide transporter permease protein OppB [Acetobacter pasteurianus IFO 32